MGSPDEDRFALFFSSFPAFNFNNRGTRVEVNQFPIGSLEGHGVLLLLQSIPLVVKIESRE